MSSNVDSKKKKRMLGGTTPNSNFKITQNNSSNEFLVYSFFDMFDISSTNLGFSMKNCGDSILPIKAQLKLGAIWSDPAALRSCGSDTRPTGEPGAIFKSHLRSGGRLNG